MAQSDNMRGAALMAGSMAGFTLNDVCMKLIGADMPLFQAVFLRGLLTSLLIVIVGRQMGAIRLGFARRDWGLIGLRTLAELGATYFFLTALFNMPIANVTAILQVLPLTIALAAALFLNEPLGWRRMVAILVGFCGVLVIVRPGAEGFTTYSIYALIAVACVTLRDLSVRRLSGNVPSLTVALSAALAITMASGVATGITGDWVALTARLLGLLALASLFIIAGYLFSVMVMRVGEIGFTAPFRYVGLLWALVLGYLVFDEWPDILTLTGAGIVVAMGVLTLYRERQLRLRSQG